MDASRRTEPLTGHVVGSIYMPARSFELDYQASRILMARLQFDGGVGAERRAATRPKSGWRR